MQAPINSGHLYCAGASYFQLSVSDLKMKAIYRKHHGAVDKHSLEQEFCKSDVVTFVV